jgi:hypothetical protein
MLEKPANGFTLSLSKAGDGIRQRISHPAPRLSFKTSHEGRWRWPDPSGGRDPAHGDDAGVFRRHVISVGYELNNETPLARPVTAQLLRGAVRHLSFRGCPLLRVSGRSGVSSVPKRRSHRFADGVSPGR